MDLCFAELKCLQYVKKLFWIDWIDKSGLFDGDECKTGIAIEKDVGMAKTGNQHIMNATENIAWFFLKIENYKYIICSL